MHINDQCSEKLPLKYSVPQSPSLGPIRSYQWSPEISEQATCIFFADVDNIIDNDIDELQIKVSILKSLLDNSLRNNELKPNWWSLLTKI